MDNFDNPTPTTTDTHDLQAQCDALRQLIVSVLILLIVISGTFTIYLLRQYRTTNADLAVAEPQFKTEMAQFSRVDAFMNEFVQKLVEYSRTHPEFTPVLTKYGIKPVPMPSQKK